MSEPTKAIVHSVESFGAADGPGVRYIIFLKGCKFRCQYCHNPDTWAGPAGQEMTADEVLQKALRCKSYWGKDGGITVSGGEPLLQIDFLIELFKKAKAEGINTCIDTAGQPFTREEPFFSKFEELMKYTDLLLLDIKEIDPEQHKIVTGHDNANILNLARYLSDIGKPIWIRHVLVPGLTDRDDDLDKLGEFIATLKNVQRVDVLPYHTLGKFKWDNLKIPYTLEGVEPPTPERVQNAKEKLGVAKYNG
ncbi:MAG: pyruvate formate-lyase-activating protein [Oscillospiraceae bacterium]